MMFIERERKKILKEETPLKEFEKKAKESNQGKTLQPPYSCVVLLIVEKFVKC
jgi:hypothetical protein